MDVCAENRGRPCPKVRFSTAPVMGSNFLTQGRPGVSVRNVRGNPGRKVYVYVVFSSLILAFEASRAFQELSPGSPPQYGWGRLFFQKWFRRGALRAGHGIPSSTEGISDEWRFFFRSLEHASPDTLAVPAFHCIRLCLKAFFDTPVFLKRTDTLSANA